MVRIKPPQLAGSVRQATPAHSNRFECNPRSKMRNSRQEAGSQSKLRKRIFGAIDVSSKLFASGSLRL